MVFQIRLGKFNEFFTTLSAIRSIPGLSGDNAVMVFLASNNLEIKFYAFTGQFEKSIQTIKNIEKGLKQYDPKLNLTNKLPIYYNIAYLYFGAGKYREALPWLNRILNEPTLDFFKTVGSYARILNLIIHYELGNTIGLENILSSAHRFLVKKNTLYKTESLMLKFMAKFLKAQNTPVLKEMFRKLKIELVKMEEDSFERKALDNFDFLSWIDSKIDNRPFGEIVRERAGKKNVFENIT